MKVTKVIIKKLFIHIFLIINYKKIRKPIKIKKKFILDEGHDIWKIMTNDGHFFHFMMTCIQ
jgi:hypothetical protein